MAMLRGGFTLVEMAFVMAVLAIILAVGVPSYASFQQRQELRAAGEALAQDLRNARELSATSPTPLFVSYRPGKEKAWCWGISAGQPCNCASGGVPACTVSRNDGSVYPHVILESAQDSQFIPGRGQAEPAGSASFGTAKGMNLKVALSAMGRATVCGKDAKGATPC